MQLLHLLHHEQLRVLVQELRVSVAAGVAAAGRAPRSAPIVAGGRHPLRPALPPSSPPARVRLLEPGFTRGAASQRHARGGAAFDGALLAALTRVRESSAFHSLSSPFPPFPLRFPPRAGLGRAPRAPSRPAGAPGGGGEAGRRLVGGGPPAAAGERIRPRGAEARALRRERARRRRRGLPAPVASGRRNGAFGRSPAGDLPGGLPDPHDGREPSPSPRARRRRSRPDLPFLRSYGNERPSKKTPLSPPFTRRPAVELRDQRPDVPAGRRGRAAPGPCRARPLRPHAQRRGHVVLLVSLFLWRPVVCEIDPARIRP